MTSSDRNLRRIYRKLVSNPFFPLLFLSEVVKEASATAIALPDWTVYGLLAVLTTAMWVVSDDVEEVVEEATE